MNVNKLLSQLEEELEEAQNRCKTCDLEYNKAIDTYSNRGTVAYLYGAYEKALNDVSKLQSTINIIKERIKYHD